MDVFAVHDQLVGVPPRKRLDPLRCFSRKPIAGVRPGETRQGSHIYRIGRLPRSLGPVAERLEPRFGKLGREYQRIAFDRKLVEQDATLEWVLRKLAGLP